MKKLLAGALIALLTLNLCVESTSKKAKPHLSTSLERALLGPYYENFDVKKLKEYWKENIEPAHYYNYDITQNSRGYELAKNAKKQMKPEYYSREVMVIFFVGASHMNAIAKTFSASHNLYYFSEAPYVETRDNFTRIAGYLFAQFASGEVKECSKKEGPIAIIYGNNHMQTFDCATVLPTGNELVSAGIERIVVFLEGIEIGRKEIDELVYHPFYAVNKEFVDYLIGLESKTGLGNRNFRSRNSEEVG